MTEHPLADQARVSVTKAVRRQLQRPTDKELMELMPESMRDEFSYAARVCSDATGAQINSVVFRTALNLAALEYARAVLDRWGSSASKGD
jgi:lipid A disaccharide synthetase